MNLINFAYQVQTFLKLAFLPLALIWPSTATKLALTVCVLAILRRHKIPQFNQEYLIQVIQNEYFFLLFGLMSLLTTSLQLSFYLLPAGIHFFFALAQYVVLQKIGPAGVQSSCNNIRVQKDNIMYSKAQVEQLLMFGLLGLMLLKMEGLVPFMLVGQMQLLKYQINLYSRKAYEQLNMRLERSIGRVPVVGGLYRLLIKGLSKLQHQVQQQQQQ